VQSQSPPESGPTPTRVQVEGASNRLKGSSLRKENKINKNKASRKQKERNKERKRKRERKKERNQSINQSGLVYSFYFYRSID
jgi:hypothetical protein